MSANLNADAATARTLTETSKRYPTLKDFSVPLIFVYNAFHQQNGLIFFDDQIPFSFIRPERRHGQRVLDLHIGTLNRPEAITVIWSALHEWGHLGQPEETVKVHNSPRLKYERELDAWLKAEVKVREYNELMPHSESFQAYRKVCLKSYLDKIKAEENV